MNAEKKILQDKEPSKESLHYPIKGIVNKISLPDSERNPISNHHLCLVSSKTVDDIHQAKIRRASPARMNGLYLANSDVFSSSS